MSISIVDRLAQTLNVPPERMRQLLERIQSEGRGVWVDSGGVRGVLRRVSVGAKDELVLERYLVLDNPPPIEELLR